jgi:sarcosine oxidase
MQRRLHILHGHINPEAQQYPILSKSTCSSFKEIELYDVIVVGVGSMGSAACYHLAKRGIKVLGIEQYDIPHSKGSYGDTRIIRLAYFEHPLYVPLLKRSYSLWYDLEREAGEKLLTITGGIDAGPKDSTLVKGSKKSCEEHGIDHEILTSSELTKKFPGIKLPDDYLAVYQKDAGILFAERCVVQHAKLAQKYGAKINTNERMLSYNHLDGGVISVKTNKCSYRTKQLVLCLGPWSNKFINFKVKNKPFNVGVPERQVVAWFEPKDAQKFQVGTFPVFILSTKIMHESKADHTNLYGFPELEGGQIHFKGFKIGLYNHFNEVIDPDVRENTIPAQRDEEVLRKYAASYFPEAVGKTVMLKECIFTKSDDGHFIIDTYPDGHGNVTIASGFSGHGFKFCSVVGEILADMATNNGQTRHRIDHLRIQSRLQ